MNIIKKEKYKGKYEMKWRAEEVNNNLLKSLSKTKCKNNWTVKRTEYYCTMQSMYRSLSSHLGNAWIFAYIQYTQCQYLQISDQV